MSGTIPEPNGLTRLVADSAVRLAMPIAVYPGLLLTGATVRDLVTNAEAQAAAAAALHARYHTPVVLTAMDLSVEAEAFGCGVRLSDTEIPSLAAPVVTSPEQAAALGIPQPGDGRTAVYLETARLLRQLPDRPLVLGGCIGPISLAARLMGVTEALEATISQPAIMHGLLEKTTSFLTAYALAFRDAGADGLLMAEPVAGLLSPRGMAEFSSSYVRRVVRALTDGRFAFVLHNCGARLVHLPAMLQASASVYHFGAPMDVPAALAQVGEAVVICGNLDPVETFLQAQPGEVRSRVARLLAAARAHRNFVVSSGCDVPPGVPLANLDAFYAACAEG